MVQLRVPKIRHIALRRRTYVGVSPSATQQLLKVKKHLAIALIASLMSVSWQLVSRVQAGELTDVSVFLSNDLPFSPTEHRSQFTIIFKTVTAGLVKTINMFLAGENGFDVQTARLLEVQGVGPGGLSVAGGLITYTVNMAVNVPAGSTIKFLIADMPNRYVGAFGGDNLQGTLLINTKDGDPITGNVIDSGVGRFVIRPITTFELTKPNIRFGTCTIDPGVIYDNAHTYVHVPTCPLGFSGSANVIAFPGGVRGTAPLADFIVPLHPRLVPKGSYAHCTPDCHLDVVIKNTAPPGGSVDDGPKVWVWISWQ